MIRYNPINSDAVTTPINYLPKTCFIMCQLKEPIPEQQDEIRKRLSNFLKIRDIKEIDADSSITGRDFLLKIWGMIFQVPVGIAIITKKTTRKTLANIFYEVGILQACGKETLVIKTKGSSVPSDFIRTEYLNYDDELEGKLTKYFDFIDSLESHFDMMAEQLEKDPLLAIDYLRRAFLITGKDNFRERAQDLFSKSDYKDRRRDCVENLLLRF
ncbi:hypothetical protein ACFLUB_01700 [Chloroflexota bacterium]